MMESERRMGDRRRKPFLLLSWDDGLAWIDRHIYTGEFAIVTAHAQEGKPKLIQVPNLDEKPS